MDTRELIESTALRYPICEFYFGKTADIPFSDKVWFICQTDCKRYGHSWACPPNCGDIHGNIEKCKKYENFFLFSTVREVENAWDAEVCLKAKGAHEEITRAIWRELREKIPCFVLSTGCTLCEGEGKTCACPEEPCRHPEERLSSMESHGIVVMQIAEEVGLCYNYGGETVVYFTIIFYDP